MVRSRCLRASACTVMCCRQPWQNPQADDRAHLPLNEHQKTLHCFRNALITGAPGKYWERTDHPLHRGESSLHLLFERHLPHHLTQRN